MSRKLYGNLELENNSGLRLTELSANGSSVVSLAAPSSLAADLALVLPGTDTANGAIVSNGSGVLSIALIVNANISGSAAIAYSKLNLSGSIVNADINASAAIAYSKLNLSGSIVNADVAAGAAIALTKLAALSSHNRVLVSDGSGFISESTVTTTTLGFLDATSSIQTQLNGKASTALSNLTVSSLALGSLLVGSSSSAVSNLAIGTTGQVLTVAGGTAVWATPSDAQTAFKANWITADGTSKTVTHNLNSTDIMVTIFDKTDGSTIEVDSEVRTDVNTLTLTASDTPGAAGWRVLILAI